MIIVDCVVYIYVVIILLENHLNNFLKNGIIHFKFYMTYMIHIYRLWLVLSLGFYYVQLDMCHDGSWYKYVYNTSLNLFVQPIFWLLEYANTYMLFTFDLSCYFTPNIKLLTKQNLAVMALLVTEKYMVFLTPLVSFSLSLLTLFYLGFFLFL